MATDLLYIAVVETLRDPASAKEFAVIEMRGYTGSGSPMVRHEFLEEHLALARRARVWADDVITKIEAHVGDRVSGVFIPRPNGNPVVPQLNNALHFTLRDRALREYASKPANAAMPESTVMRASREAIVVMQPTVGRIVHLNSKRHSDPIAAIVTRVRERDGWIEVTAFYPGVDARPLTPVPFVQTKAEAIEHVGEIVAHWPPGRP